MRGAFEIRWLESSERLARNVARVGWFLPSVRRKELSRNSQAAESAKLVNGNQKCTDQFVEVQLPLVYCSSHIRRALPQHVVHATKYTIFEIKQL